MGELSIFFPESLVSCHSRIWFSFFFFVFAFKRTYNDRLSVSQERNVSSRGYQRFQGQQLQRPGLEDQGDGLADWFVIKHSRDEALSRDLLSKYGFKAADVTQVETTEYIYNWNFALKSIGQYILHGGPVKLRRMRKARSLNGTKLYRLYRGGFRRGGAGGV